MSRSLGNAFFASRFPTFRGTFWRPSWNGPPDSFLFQPRVTPDLLKNPKDRNLRHLPFSIPAFAFLSLGLLPSFLSAQIAAVDLSVDFGAAGTPISPLSYGVNQDPGGGAVTIIPAFRQGGNRLTGYNWEHNASNAGSDAGHSSDAYLLQTLGLPQNINQDPATVVTHFVLGNQARGAESIVTIPIAGYVADDMDGSVAAGETAPSPRWSLVVANKPVPLMPYTLTPNEADGVVFMDEFVNYLLTLLGPAGGGGVRYYNLDNEPALWSGTHSRLHPANATYTKVLNRGVTMATMVTAMDPGAELMGPVLYGWSAYTQLQNQPQLGAPYNSPNNLNFINYYLNQMAQASSSTGRRLLHYLDVHWYPEATGGGTRITFNPGASNATTVVSEARMQAPRSL